MRTCVVTRQLVVNPVVNLRIWFLAQPQRLLLSFFAIAWCVHEDGSAIYVRRRCMQVLGGPDSLVQIFRDRCLYGISEFTFVLIVFLEQEIDGSAVKYGLGTSSGYKR